MDKVRIVFMGTPEFSCGILEALVQNEYDVVACVSQPDKPTGRKQVLTSPPLKILAQSHGIPVLQPIKIREDYQSILAYQPDLIVTCAYGQLIPKAVLDYPRLGCINVHASLLPKYRGGAPIHYAVLNGDKQTGVTIMKMVEKMDAGDMLSQASLDIDECDTTSVLFNRLMMLGQTLLISTLPDYLDNKISPIVQNEDEVTFAYNITKQQEYVDFYQETKVVYNHIRGLIGWPVGYTMINDLKIKLYGASYQIDENANAGQVYGLDELGIKVGTVGGYIYLKELQVSGKNKQSAKEFYNGYKQKILHQFIRRKENVNQ